MSMAPRRFRSRRPTELNVTTSISESGPGSPNNTTKCSASSVRSVRGKKRGVYLDRDYRTKLKIDIPEGKNRPESAKYEEMIKLESQSSVEGEPALSDNESCTQALSTRCGNVPGYGRGPIPPLQRRVARNTYDVERLNKISEEIAELQSTIASMGIQIKFLMDQVASLGQSFKFLK